MQKGQLLIKLHIYFLFRFLNYRVSQKNALSELCGICVGTKFFGYFEQASLQPSF